MFEVKVTTYKGASYTRHWYETLKEAQAAIVTIKSLGYRAELVK